MKDEKTVARIEEIWVQNQAYMHRYALGLTKDFQLAEDVCVEVMIKLVNHIDKLEVDNIWQNRAYIKATIFNTFVDMKRHEKITETPTPDDMLERLNQQYGNNEPDISIEVANRLTPSELENLQKATPEEIENINKMPADEAALLIMRILHELPADMREAYILHKRDEVGYNEIAQQYKETECTIRQRVTSAL